MGTRIKNNLSSGFTLIELMIVIAIAGILAMIAMPNYTKMVKNNCITTKANTLVNSLQFARSEAVKRNKPVLLKASNATDSNEWGNGWEIVDDKGAVIRVIELGCAAILIDETKKNLTSLTYTGDGFIEAVGLFKICEPKPEEESDNTRGNTQESDKKGEGNKAKKEGRKVTLSTTGRPAVSDFDSSDKCQ